MHCRCLQVRKAFSVPHMRKQANVSHSSLENAGAAQCSSLQFADAATHHSNRRIVFSTEQSQRNHWECILLLRDVHRWVISRRLHGHNFRTISQTEVACNYPIVRDVRTTEIFLCTVHQSSCLLGIRPRFEADASRRKPYGATNHPCGFRKNVHWCFQQAQGRTDVAQVAWQWRAMLKEESIRVKNSSTRRPRIHFA